jgi:hypothetical protein
MSMDNNYVYVQKQMYFSPVPHTAKTHLKGTHLSASQNIKTSFHASVHCCDDATDDSLDSTGSFVSCHHPSVVDNVGTEKQNKDCMTTTPRMTLMMVTI